MCVGLYVSGRMCVTVSSVWGRFEMMRYLPTNVFVLCLCLYVVGLRTCMLFKGCCDPPRMYPVLYDGGDDATSRIVSCDM